MLSTGETKWTESYSPNVRGQVDWCLLRRRSPEEIPDAAMEGQNLRILGKNGKAGSRG